MTTEPIAAGSPPIVSVVMANFNGAGHIEEAIRSVQDQTISDFEIIVSDDASTDRSVDIIARLRAADGRIRLLRSNRNTGAAAARNRAIQNSKGQWVAIVDSDDVIHPERLATLVELAERDDADIVADDLVEFHTDISKPVGRLLANASWTKPAWVNIVDYVRLNHFYGRGPSLGYLKPIFRGSLVGELGDRYDETLRITEDFDLVLRLLRAGKKMKVYPLPYYFYRKHLNSISFRLNKEVLEAIRSANLRILRGIADCDSPLKEALNSRIRSIDTAIEYENLLNALRAKNWLRSAKIGLINPKAAALLRLPFFVRLQRLQNRLLFGRIP
jgi:glycosyltransferase involved in cell wall biosynthesis